MDVSDSTYQHLRAVAGRYLKGRSGHTLQPTALVNEAYLKLDRKDSAVFESREHFLAIASRVMRDILVDHARRKGAAKRGGEAAHVTVSGVAMGGQDEAIDLLALDLALEKLSELNARHARVVELRFFGGLSADEAARVLNVSLATIERDWAKARAWLLLQLRTQE
ncbi:MAG: ECF-type sigma factor [Myxococcota bacterium]